MVPRSILILPVLIFSNGTSHGIVRSKSAQYEHFLNGVFDAHFTSMNLTLIGLMMAKQTKFSPLFTVSSSITMRRLAVHRSMFRQLMSPVIHSVNVHMQICQTAFSMIHAQFLAFTQTISGQTFRNDYTQDFGTANVTFFACSFEKLNVVWAVKTETTEDSAINAYSCSAFGCIVKDALFVSQTCWLRDCVFEEHDGSITRFSPEPLFEKAQHSIERVHISRSTLGNDKNATFLSNNWAVNGLNISTCVCRNAILSREQAHAVYTPTLKFIQSCHCIMDRQEYDETTSFYYIPRFRSLSINHVTCYNMTDKSGNPSSFVIHIPTLGVATICTLSEMCFLKAGSQALSFFKAEGQSGTLPGTLTATNLYFDHLDTPVDKDSVLRINNMDNVQYGVEMCGDIDPSEQTPEPPRNVFEYGIIADIKRTFRYT